MFKNRIRCTKLDSLFLLTLVQEHLTFYAFRELDLYISKNSIELAYKTSASLFMLRKHLNNLNMSSYTRPISRRNYLDDNENKSYREPESHTRAAKKNLLMISKVCVNQRILIQKKVSNELAHKSWR